MNAARAHAGPFRLLLVFAADATAASLAEAVRQTPDVSLEVERAAPGTTADVIGSGNYDACAFDDPGDGEACFSAAREARARGWSGALVFLTPSRDADAEARVLSSGGEPVALDDDPSAIVRAIHRAILRASALAPRPQPVTAAERSRAERFVAEELAAIRSFVAGVVHEISNPLAAVLANVSYLQEKLATNEISDPLRDALEDAWEGSARLNAVVHVLRGLMQDDFRHRSAIDVASVVDVAIGLAWNKARRRTPIVRDFADVPAVLVTEGALLQAVVRLLLSAAEAFEPRVAQGGVVFLRLRSDAASVCVEVTHEGSTSPEADAAAAMHDDASLGIAICGALVRDLGGDVEVCVEGEATTFRLTLPAAEHRAEGA